MLSGHGHTRPYNYPLENSSDRKHKKFSCMACGEEKDSKQRLIEHIYENHYHGIVDGELVLYIENLENIFLMLQRVHRGICNFSFQVSADGCCGLRKFKVINCHCL